MRAAVVGQTAMDAGGGGDLPVAQFRRCLPPSHIRLGTYKPDRMISSHPRVLEAAAIPVPAELGEDDILVVVVRKPGAELAADEIADRCREHLAAINAPRYVVFADALPHTPTLRVAKFKLRADPSLRSRSIDLGP